MTKEEIERVDELVNEFGKQIAKEVKSEKDFLAWLVEARDNMSERITELAE